MNIGLIVSFWPTQFPDSGIGNLYHQLACSLAARGHRVTVFHVNSSKPFWKPSRNDQEQGFEVIELPCRVMPNEQWTGWLPASHAVALVRLFVKLRTQPRPLDVIETVSYNGFAWLCSKLIWRGTPPILIRICTTGEQMKPFTTNWSNGRYSGRLEGRLIRRASNLCTHTASHRDQICADFGLDADRIDLIPIGVNLPDASFSPPATEKVVLYVGRFESRKGTDVLLKAIPLVLAKQPDCRFVLVGGGPTAKSWQEAFLRQHPGLAGQVRFPGRVPIEELERLYQTCDFFVAPSLYESFGIIYLEAMRYGKPVIGCLDSGGSPEVIGDGGLLVPPGDEAALAEAIIRLWTDRDLHQELSGRARTRAQYYSVERQAERSEEVYSRLIQAA